MEQKKEIESKAQLLLEKAKAMMIISFPFFASIILRLRFELDYNVPTMATDSVKLFFNPNFVTSITRDENIGVLCHEVLHVVLKHPFRRRMRHPVLWNIACDYAVNLVIIKSNQGITLPGGALYEEKFTDMTAEDIYSHLEKETEENVNNLGSLVIGEVKDYVQGGTENKDDDGSGTDQSDGYSRTKDEQERHCEIQVAEAANAAKQRGTLPANLDRMISEILNPVLPWREILIRFVTEKSKDDYAFSKPNKRYAYAGLYLPTLESPSMRNIGVIIDTSGSINEKQLQEFASELSGILAITPGVCAEVLYVDADMQGHQTLSSEEILDMKPKGGGGTSFVPGFDYLKEKDMDLACVVYFTDGECNDFPKTQEYETIWCLTYRNKRFNPPFGEVIFLVDE